jgi:hypothetical protein
VRAMTPRLAEILALMAEAALAAEDSVAGGGNMPDRRDRGQGDRSRPRAQRRRAKEAAS